jgi:uncharacterized NAD(P)/FAD-binding protein YdhS
MMGKAKKERTEKLKVDALICQAYVEGVQKLQQQRFDGLKARGIIVEDTTDTGINIDTADDGMQQ